jgi:predicted Fe-Mo cluster-binding NifX family protein
MKIAITTKGNSLESALDPRFGRAERFIIYDSETKTFELLENAQNLNAPQGAGVQAAGSVAQSGAEVLISGHVGPKAFQVLNASGVKIYCTDLPTVSEALAAYEANQLQQVSEPTVEEHWV